MQKIMEMAQILIKIIDELEFITRQINFFKIYRSLYDQPV